MQGFELNDGQLLVGLERKGKEIGMGFLGEIMQTKGRGRYGV